MTKYDLDTKRHGYVQLRDEEWCPSHLLPELKRQRAALEGVSPEIRAEFDKMLAAAISHIYSGGTCPAGAGWGIC